MDENVLVATRTSLHAVAEQVLAGPQYRESGTIRLRVVPGGFAQVKGPLRIEGSELLVSDRRVPLVGTIADIAAAAGVEAGVPEGLYSDHAEFGADEELAVDPAAAGVLAEWFARGDAGLRAFAAEEPVIWPEHFDLAISSGEVNYGVSPGDGGHAGPYAYVGPWTPREGEFWNASFGARRTAEEVPDAEALAAFFAAGRDA